MNSKRCWSGIWFSSRRAISTSRWWSHPAKREALESTLNGTMIFITLSTPFSRESETDIILILDLWPTSRKQSAPFSFTMGATRSSGNILHGRPVVGLSGERFLGYLQNHDQIGNRATGERISHLLSVGRQKIGAALVLLSPLVPMLFQGEEFGSSSPFLYFTSHEDPEFGRLVSEGRRREFAAFGWKLDEIPDPQDVRTYDASKLDWTEREREPHRSILNWHRDLIRLRHSTPDLINGRLDRVNVTFDESANWFKVERGRVTLVCNLSARPSSVPVPDTADIILASESGAKRTPEAVLVPAESAVVLQTQ